MGAVVGLEYSFNVTLMKKKYDHTHDDPPSITGMKKSTTPEAVHFLSGDMLKQNYMDAF